MGVSEMNKKISAVLTVLFLGTLAASAEAKLAYQSPQAQALADQVAGLEAQYENSDPDNPNDAMALETQLKDTIYNLANAVIRNCYDKPSYKNKLDFMGVSDLAEAYAPLALSTLDLARAACMDGAAEGLPQLIAMAPKPVENVPDIAPVETEAPAATDSVTHSAIAPISAQTLVASAQVEEAPEIIEESISAPMQSEAPAEQPATSN